MDSAVEERWLPILGYEGLYAVSNYGRIRSEARLCKSRYGSLRRVAERILIATPCKSAHGYLQIRLHKDCRGKTFLVHLLVMRAFKGDAPYGMECAHVDGDPENASLSNLKWTEHSHNELDKLRHGTMPIGAKHHFAKLSAEDVIAIRYDCRPHRDIAAQYDVNQSTVSRIKTWQRRKNVELETSNEASTSP